MSEQRPPQEGSEDDLDFGALLDAAESAEFDPEPGETVQGRIVSITDDFVFISLGGKSEGMLERIELANLDGSFTLNVGDTIEAVVRAINTPDGFVRLSRRLGQHARGDEEIRAAFESKLPVSGKVTGRNKGGYEVAVAGARAFCPQGQIDVAPTANPDEHVGKTYDFLIIEYAENGRKFVVSRAQLFRNQQAEAKAAAKGKLKEGQIYTGTVTGLREFGVFVDVLGVSGLVHVSELSWARTESPDSVVKIGDTVPVEVLSIDWSRDRVSLSVKQAQKDPWSEVESLFSVGQTLRRHVARVEDFGAFVELAPGLDGLVHISELTWDRRVRRAADVVRVGQEVDVVVLGIDVVKKRISLGMKQLSANPWETAQERYTPGNIVDGTVSKVADFGIFVDLESGITGLIPKSESATDRTVNIRRFFQVGAPIQAQVLEIDPAAKKLTLTRKPLVEGADTEGTPPPDERRQRPPQGHRPPREQSRRRDEEHVQLPPPSKGGMGTFADLMKDTLSKLKPPKS